MDYSRFPKVQPGSSTPNISASAWNKLMDIAAWYDREVVHKQLSETKPPLFERRNCILIKNTTGSHLTTGNVLAIRGSVYDPTSSIQREFYRSEPILLGVAPLADRSPDPSDCGYFAILQEPIAAGSIGWAAIDGIVSCTINMRYQLHRYADIGESAETDKLLSNEAGGAEIIHVEDQDVDPGEWEAGDKLALVRLGCFHNPLLVVAWDGPLSSSTGAVDGYVFDGPSAGSPVTDGRAISLVSSLNKFGEATTLVLPEFGYAYMNRYMGLHYADLVATSRMFPLPPSGFTGTGTYMNFTITDGKVFSAS